MTEFEGRQSMKIRKVSGLVPLLLSVALLAACGDYSGGDRPPPDPFATAAAIPTGISEAENIQFFVETVWPIVNSETCGGCHTQAGGRPFPFADINHTLADESQFLCGSAGDINYPARDKRPAIIDTQNDRLPVGQIGHAHFRSERESFVCGRQGVAVVGFAVGRQVAVQAVVIVRSETLLNRSRRVSGLYRRCSAATGQKSDDEQDAEPFQPHLRSFPGVHFQDYRQ